MERRKTTNPLKILVVIAHYNHHATLRQVAQACREVWPHVVVVDDGSDPSPRGLLDGLDVSFLRHDFNQGKGRAILTGASYARENGFTHVLTIDADGQHDPKEIPLFVQAVQDNPQSIIMGVRKFDDTVPFGSRFGRKFGNFWVHVQTGKKVRDIQSGYRCYPVELLRVLSVHSVRYAFEVEIVVRALWGGFTVNEIDISVVYPKNRISHFHQWKDNARLTALNTWLTLRSMVPLAHRQYLQAEGELKRKSYAQTLRENLSAPGSTVRNALSAAWGIFCGSIALPGIRQIFLFWGAGWWNLNRLLCVGFEKLCIGPFVPALCIEAGYFMRHGHFLTQFNITTLGRQALQRVWEWVLGSLVVAPLLAGITCIVVLVIGWFLHRSLHGNA